MDSEDHVEHLQFHHAVIATGSRPASLPALPVDQERVLDSSGALALSELPDDLLVVGGGYIGVELGTAYARLGSRVAIVELADRILGEFDDDVVSVVASALERLGVSVRTGTAVVSIDDVVHLHRSGVAETVKASHVLVAVGRVANSDDLQLEDAGLSAGPGGLIAVDEQQRTANRAIFAIGDITDGAALAHKASEQGRVAAEAMCGEPAAFDQLVPLVAFCEPEVAAVGVSERSASAAGLRVVVGKAMFGVNGRALTIDQPDGFVKLVADAEHGVLLGAQVVGPEASELISELTVAVECALRLDDVAGAIHPHPTLGEAIVEAARRARRRIVPTRSS